MLAAVPNISDVKRCFKALPNSGIDTRMQKSEARLIILCAIPLAVLAATLPIGEGEC